MLAKRAQESTCRPSANFDKTTQRAGAAQFSSQHELPLSSLSLLPWACWTPQKQNPTYILHQYVQRSESVQPVHTKKIRCYTLRNSSSNMHKTALGEAMIRACTLLFPPVRKTTHKPGSFGCAMGFHQGPHHTEQLISPAFCSLKNLVENNCKCIYVFTKRVRSKRVHLPAIFGPRGQGRGREPVGSSGKEQHQRAANSKAAWKASRLHLRGNRQQLFQLNSAVQRLINALTCIRSAYRKPTHEMAHPLDQFSRLGYSATSMHGFGLLHT